MSRQDGAPPEDARDAGDADGRDGRDDGDARDGRDGSIARLARLFAEHPAWRDAAARVSADATSTVYFSHSPDRAWRLELGRGAARLLPGAAEDPDFVFRFSPRAIERLADTEGGLGDFAVALFALVEEDEVQLRIVAGFGRLVGRGYLRLLLAGGLPVLAFGARRGIRSVGALRRFVSELRRSGPADWEG